MTQEILSRLDVLAAKLGQTAQVLWPHAVRHTAIEGFAAIGIWCVSFSAAIIAIVIGLFWGHKQKWVDGPYIVPLIFGFVFLAGSILGASVDGASTVAKALEPTGHTVKQILRGAR